ncbi:MAG TPA: alpha/beta hydrolase, partial [Saprospiraceae bacterium]|nr:alpha/beta hydrolase [Saprospiraceae bacterium]
SAPFIKFIEQELQPFIERNYRTTPEKTLIGQSLGGLLATEILFTKPDMFDNYIIVSPSLWWNDEYLIKKRTKPVVYTTNKKIFVAVGKEGDIMEREAKELYERLDKVKKDNTQLYFQFFENQNHGDVLHVAVYSAFEHLFMKHEDAKK